MSDNKAFHNKTILVTGGGGFVGKALVQRLKQEGTSVILWDAKQKIDVCNWKQIARLNKRKTIDVVYHLAAASFVPYSWDHPREINEINIIGTLNMLEFCRRRNVGKFVFISSYVYGRPTYLPIDENHLVEPANPYTWSKHVGENLCMEYAKNFGVKSVIIRPFNIFGEGQSPQFLIPSIIWQIRNTKAVVLDDPRPKRDFLYLSDMIEALVAAGQYNPRTIEIFNIGFGRSFSVRKIARLITKTIGEKIQVRYRNKARKGEILDIIADITKAEQSLGWQPQVSLEEGLGRMLKLPELKEKKI